MRFIKKMMTVFFPLFLWYPPRITAQFSTSAFRSPCISAANKALITRYTLLLVYSLLYVLTISWCMLFHYASSLSLALSYPAIHSARSFPRQLTWHSTENDRAKFAKARIEISLRSPVYPFLEIRFQAFARSRIIPDRAVKINFHEAAFRTERARILF